PLEDSRVELMSNERVVVISDRRASQGDESTPSKTSAARGFLHVLIARSLLMGLSIGYSRVITTLYAVKMDASGWMLAAVAVSQSIGMLALAPSAGRWVDLHGARVVFVLGSAWALVICLLTPLVPTFPA